MFPAQRPKSELEVSTTHSVSSSQHCSIFFPFKHLSPESAHSLNSSDICSASTVWQNFKAGLYLLTSESKKGERGKWFETRLNWEVISTHHIPVVGGVRRRKLPLRSFVSKYVSRNLSQKSFATLWRIKK